MEEIEPGDEESQELPPFKDAGDTAPAQQTTFGKALQNERITRGWTQRKLADMLGTSQQNVQGWESGKALPTEKFHQRMLEVFGEDSVLAYLQVKRSQVIVVPSATMTVTRADGSVKSSVTAEPVMFQRRQESVAKIHQPAPPDSFGPVDIRDKLAMEMRSFVDVRVGRWTADYLSSKLCLEIKRVTGNRADIMARLGMQQLCVLRNVLRKEDKRDRIFALVLVVADLEPALRQPSLQLMQREAAELDIELLVMSKLESLIDMIDQVEAGAWGSAAVDDFDPL